MLKLAKQIRKPGENWKDCVKRAAAMIKAKKGGCMECKLPIGGGAVEEEEKERRKWMKRATDSLDSRLSNILVNALRVDPKYLKLADLQDLYDGLVKAELLEAEPHRPRAKAIIVKLVRARGIITEGTTEVPTEEGKTAASSSVEKPQGTPVMGMPAKKSDPTETQIVKKSDQQISERQDLYKLLETDKNAIKELSRKLGVELKGKGPYFNADLNLFEMMMGQNENVEEQQYDSVLDNYDDDEKFKAMIGYTLYINGLPRKFKTVRTLTTSTIKNIMPFLDRYYSPTVRSKPRNVFNITVDAASFQELNKLVKNDKETQAIRIDYIKATDGSQVEVLDV